MHRESRHGVMQEADPAKSGTNKVSQRKRIGTMEYMKQSTNSSRTKKEAKWHINHNFSYGFWQKKLLEITRWRQFSL